MILCKINIVLRFFFMSTLESIFQVIDLILCSQSFAILGI